MRLALAVSIAFAVACSAGAYAYLDAGHVDARASRPTERGALPLRAIAPLRVSAS